MGALLDIGTRLVVARRVRGLSQRELGQLIGVHQQQVARWEAAAYRNAGLERVDAAATALGLDLAAPVVDGRWSSEETTTAYGPEAASGVAPVRDLGEVAARIRADTDTLTGEYGFGRIGVFGSFATGEQTSRSDVDLLVEFADIEKVKGLRFVAAANHVEDLLGRPTDIVRPHLLRERLRPRVMRDVVYVWPA